MLPKVSSPANVILIANYIYIWQRHILIYASIVETTAKMSPCNHGSRLFFSRAHNFERRNF